MHKEAINWSGKKWSCQLLKFPWPKLMDVQYKFHFLPFHSYKQYLCIYMHYFFLTFSTSIIQLPTELFIYLTNWWIYKGSLEEIERWSHNITSQTHVNINHSLDKTVRFEIHNFTIETTFISRVTTFSAKISSDLVVSRWCSI